MSNNNAVVPRQSRKRTLLLGSTSTYGMLAVTIVVSLASVPIGLHYFGPVLYGVWLVISSILAYLRMCNFGVNLSTLTLMAQTPDESHQRSILKRSVGFLVVTSIALIGVALIASHLFPEWVSILGKIPLDLRGEAAEATLAIGILLLAQLPITVFSSAFSGLQEVHWERAYTAFRAIIALVALVTTVWIGGSLVTLAIFTGLGSIFVGIVSGVHLFVTHPQVRPRFTERVADAPSSRFLFTSGIRFLALQIANLIIHNTDNLIISHYLGPKAVTPYGITFRLFYMAISVVSAVTIVLWPMYGRAAGGGDWNWVQRTYNRCASMLPIAGGLAWIGGIIFAEAIINLWAGPVAYGGLFVAFALGGWAYIASFGGSNFSLINGLNPTTSVVVFSFIDAALNIGISLALVGPFGIGGVALGTFLACFAVHSWFGPLYIRRRTGGKVKLSIRPIMVHAIGAVLPCVVLALLAALYSPAEWMRLTGGVAIIVLYTVLSWHLMPIDSRNLVRNVVISLRARVGW